MTFRCEARKELGKFFFRTSIHVNNLSLESYIIREAQLITYIDYIYREKDCLIFFFSFRILSILPYIYMYRKNYEANQQSLHRLRFSLYRTLLIVYEANFVLSFLSFSPEPKLLNLLELRQRANNTRHNRSK